MKKSYILSSLALASLGFFAFQQAEMESGIVQKFSKEHRFSGGGQSGLTGAPGEANCTQCHSGTTQDGSTQNSVLFLSGTTPVTEYTPGDTYTVTLSLASSPAKSGFSATALDATDTKAGTLIGAGVGGTQNFSASGRDYVSHTLTSNTSAQWAFSWIAPATDVGIVTFYFASNETNDNGATSGDVIYLSEHTIGAASGAGIEETSNEAKFTAGYNATSNKLVLDFNSFAVGDMNLNLVDMSGRSVFTYDLGTADLGSNKETIVLPSDLNDGMYVVHFFVGNKAMSANILVKK
ncbi:MAG: hypothetical protein HRT58_03240 [Crocinitomicaceae bacterium]|nr:hypothetical protein [Flavobacteriales bacterium]NQZ34646.1 hypothetical protein [Crocinitomicaceae bacterium]